MSDITLSDDEADYICDVLIEMAQRLPMKHRNHENALRLLGWFTRAAARSTHTEETR